GSLAFGGANANGTWTLFLADLSGGDISTLVSWGMDISVVPEPITWALLAFALVGGAMIFVRRRLALA
ncbi:MAG: Proprotein convertase P-domain, partial [Verrucomicrobiota bacterium]